MGKIRLFSTICLAKLAGFGSRLLGRGGGDVIPGAIAKRLFPDILSVLSVMVREKIFVITGTNGKTGVCHLLCESLEAEGKKVISNRSGANLLNGVISAFVCAVGFNGKLKADYACIEVDEAAAKTIFNWLKPDCIVLTNIFRDQLDRMGEVDLICEKLETAFSLVPEATLVYNGDDSLSREIILKIKNPSVPYGIEEVIFDETARSGSLEGIFCGFCGKKLSYRRIQYGHLGDYQCPGCSFGRPKPEYMAAHIRHSGAGYSFELNGRPVLAKTPFPYHVYNTLSVYAALQKMDGPMVHFEETVAAFDYGNNRETEFSIGGTCIQLHLAKNPVGFQQKLSLLAKDKEPKDLVIQINDQVQDGRDVSWIWDVDFKCLSHLGIQNLVAAGDRRFDMKLRLKYEDVPCRVSENLLKTLRELIRSGTGNLYVIVNYSGLNRTNRMLRKLQISGKGGKKN